MVLTICSFDFVSALFHFYRTVDAGSAVLPFGGFGTALLLYGGGAIVLSGIKESLAKIAAVTMLIVFRLPLLIGYALGVTWLCVLYGVRFLLEKVGKNEEK